MAHITVEEQLRDNNHDCIILVHPFISILESARKQCLTDALVVEFNIGKQLSTVLRDVSLGDRGRTAQRWLNDEFRALKPDQVLCTQIDLLFEPTLGIDPLMLFRQIARSKRIIVLWPGDFSNESLTYATPDHSLYRTWQINDPSLSIYRLVNETLGASNAL